MELELVGDIGSAALASTFVSPFVTLVDRAVIQSASGAQKLGAALLVGIKELAFRPWAVYGRLETRLVWVVYLGTYGAANTISTVSKRYDVKPGAPQLVGTTVANMTLSIWKDQALTKMFGTSAPRPLPMSSYAFFAGRDLMTIGASFTIPPVVSAYLQREAAFTKPVSDVTAQILCPMGIQALTTPVHLWALDLYNNPARSVAERVRFIGTQYVPVVSVRAMRVLPAFGIGGLANSNFRLMAKQYFASN
ncbi:hypothetical protein SmJEL517_g03105 [Synchytrium microbalum]|uniref:Mitochondrial fission process protein 1 n=1 Tax=Synchytrium microbalum TaxID=1806994 RepID=A0A507BY05_9FUNG|nr:uncharacterized protein SmJEL517_g03105 [Synchytrium microbalum]TPX34200.1 hypothetical protein SmJEL517_g03105 [Synchytrium microbalum]